MINFFPLKYYYDIFVYFSFILVVINLFHAFTLKLNDEKNIKFLRSTGVVLLILIILYLGLRPVSGKEFGDMVTYARYFRNYSEGASVNVTKDIVFHYYMKTSSHFLGLHGFFLLTVALYVLPMYFLSKRNFNKYWFYSFFMFVISFSFYTYGTNGIRNGLATSFFLWGLCYKNKKIIMILFFILSALFHKTLLLPIGAFSLTYLYNNPITYLKSWLISIPLSLFLGSVFILLFTSLGFGDDRLAGYLTGTMQTDTRFRWDFLFYSAFPIFAGWYFIVKQKFNDSFYNQVFSTYLMCNAFWVLVIRANFSNRFAYLSWFLMAFIIIYPLLKKQFFKNQQLIIAKVVTAYFMFTFLMFFLYYADKN
ncbi:EpsG family protein [Algibacter lectus]|uniref:EpsG family protein n=1 Tax=Algibacter lectus TaxID=221126 RepID=UPI0008E57416|nr:EpsG family protein [Algibacter lectus]SFC35535.1 EpsG family protein [Algibacter lectus]